MRLRHNNRSGLLSQGGCNLCKPRYYRNDHDVGLAYKLQEAAEPFLPDEVQEWVDWWNQRWWDESRIEFEESWAVENRSSPYDDGRGYYTPRSVA
jgi:hypothetical protein